MDKREAIAQSMVSQAMSGNLKAQAQIIQLQEKTGQLVEPGGAVLRPSWCYRTALPRRRIIERFARYNMRCKKALSWNQELVAGKIDTMTEIAQREELGSAYVALLMRLAYLAPDIMERIFTGDVPATLSLESIKCMGISYDWQIQRQHYGFADSPD